MADRVLVSAERIAAVCGVKSATVLAWYRRGWIPGYRAGLRPILFNVDEVQQRLADRAQGQRRGGVPHG